MQTALQGVYTDNWYWNYNRYHQNQNRWYNTSSGQYNKNNTKHPAGDLASHWSWDHSMKKSVHIHTSYQNNGDKDINPVLADAVAKSDRSKNVFTWSDITPFDMSTILSSIYIVTYSNYLFKYFGAEIARIELARQMPQGHFDHIKALTKGSYIRGKFVPNRHPNVQ